MSKKKPAIRQSTVAELNSDTLPKSVVKRRKRIDTMTDSERAMMPGWAARWIDVGLSTERADRATFEAAVRACYRHSGLSEPKRIIWCPSPIVVALAAPIASKILTNLATRGSDDAVHGAVDDAVHGAVRDAVNGAVGGAVNGAVRDAVHGAVRGAVSGAVRDAVNGAVRDAVHGAVSGAVNGAVNGAVGDAVNGAVGDAVNGAVGDAVRGAVRGIGPGVLTASGSEWHRYIGGQLWVGGWYYGSAYAMFFIDALGLDLGAEIELRARAYSATAQACWWWPHRDFVMVSERPEHLARDDRGRLHCATRAAIEFPDGWGVYSWHGVTVPREWILNPEKLDAKTALSWPNIEQRRAAAEILGWEKILAQTNARTIDKDPDPMIGELLEVDLPGSPKERFLRVRCGTQRSFCLPVPPTMKTALEANGWTYDVSGPDLKQFRNYAART